MEFSCIEKYIVGNLNVICILYLHAEILTSMEGRFSDQGWLRLGSNIKDLKSGLLCVVLSSFNKLNTTDGHFSSFYDFDFIYLLPISELN